MPQLIAVGRVSDIPVGTGRQMSAAGHVIAVFNVQGRFYAIGGNCTHRGGPLGEGELDGVVVTCPWHGGQFDVTNGQVMRSPPIQNEPVYRVVVDADQLKVEIP
jgi:nitrite reductase/ring-hydroxylating ferredoxin subunit